jgi:phosphatidylglycerol:prolipoprotein diacylglycerol transferase
MHPILLTFPLGGTEVVLRAYGTFYVLAWVAAVALGTVVAWKRGFSWWRVLVTFAGALAVGIAGARLLDLGVNWDYYAKDLSRAYGLGFRGFALDGGLIIALATAVLLSRAFRLNLWRLADSAVPALAAGIVLMRVGCFLNGCCFGRVTSLPWGVTFPTGSPAWAQQLITGQTGLLGFVGGVRPVHPTQLYEMIAAAVLGGCAVWLLRRRDAEGRERFPTGIPFLTFALGFTLFRLGNNFLRVQPPTVVVPGWLYPAFFLAIGTGLAGLLLWRLRRIPGKKETIS